MWIEVNDRIYHLTPDLSEICLVETYFGKGKILEMTDALKTDINNAWHYHPYDYYSGTYINESDELVINHVYEADSTVQIQIKKFEVEN